MVKILLVEDEGIIAADMENMLTKMGYDVIETAMDFDEAIERLEEDTPDLILLDINLGGKKDGIDLNYELLKSKLDQGENELTVIYLYI